MKCDELQIILSFDLERAEKIWHTVVGYCKKKSIDMKEFTYRKDTLNLTKKRKSIGFKSENLEIHYSNIRNGNHSLLWIIKKDVNDLRFDFEEFCNIFIAEYTILQAWYANREYKHWQNEDDIRIYTRDYGDVSHLKLIDNGSPYPLNKTIIDISNNPGRRVIKDGYVDAVSSKMFIGEDFWDRVGTKKEDLGKLDFINISQINEKTIKIEVKNVDCFIDESTKDIQNKLRETLFGSK